jgi:hypothetical protein
MGIEFGIEDDLIMIGGVGLVLIYFFLWNSNSQALRDLACIYGVFCVIAIVVGVILDLKKFRSDMQ